MAVTAQLVSGQLVRFSGLDSRVPKSKWRTWLTDVAEQWLEQIAEDFADEKAAGRALKANTPAYDESKARLGLDLRRGHREGHLQAALDEARWFKVGAVQGNETATIELTEDRLFHAVEWAEYYQRLKVVGGKILVVTRRMAADAEDYLNDRLVDVLGKEALRQRRRANQRANARLIYEETRTTGARAVRVRVA